MGEAASPSSVHGYLPNAGEEDQGFRRLPSHLGLTSLFCNVRIIAATHRNLESAIEAGMFREDLFYRLNVFPIEIPPLRERISDLPLLITQLIADNPRIEGINLSACALQALSSHAWPGNERELENLLERLSVLYPATTVSRQQLPTRYRGSADAEASIAPSKPFPCESLPVTSSIGWVDLKNHLAAVELDYIRRNAGIEWRGGRCSAASATASNYFGGET